MQLPYTALIAKDVVFDIKGVHLQLLRVGLVAARRSLQPILVHLWLFEVGVEVAALAVVMPLPIVVELVCKGGLTTGPSGVGNRC